MIFFIFILTSVLTFGSVVPQFPDTGDLKKYQASSTSPSTVLEKLIRSATPCECIESECSCGYTFFNGNPSNFDSGKVIMKLGSNNDLFLKLQVGEGESHITARDVSVGVDLPPLCRHAPGNLPGVRFCAVFYDVRLSQDDGFHICINVEQQALTTTIGQISFDCLSISTNAVNIVPPDLQRPSLVGLHIGKTPTITFFNTVSIGIIPPFVGPPIAGGGVSDLIKYTNINSEIS